MKTYIVERRFNDFAQKEIIECMDCTDAFGVLVDLARRGDFDSLHLHSRETGCKYNLLFSYYKEGK